MPPYQLNKVNKMGQLLEFNTLLKVIEELKAQGKTIVTTNGCFDLMHLGHLNYLSQAKLCGDILVVGVNTDKSVQTIKGPSRPINNELDRALLLAGLFCIDYVFLFDEDTPVTFLKKIKPHIHVKADDYSVKSLPEAETVFSLGAELKFIPLTQGRSTTDIIDKIVVNYMHYDKD